MAYGIIRVKKLKTMEDVKSSGRHNFREQPTKNADPRIRNIHATRATTTSALVSNVQAIIDECEKVKKNQVRCLEYLVTASPEKFERHGGTMRDNDQYLKDALKFLKDKHGEENIAGATIHLDERSPHLIVYVVPVVYRAAKEIKRWVFAEGGTRKLTTTKQGSYSTLASKDFTGGPKMLAQLQTDFYNQVSSKHDLCRGVPQSKSEHKTIREYYSEIESLDSNEFTNRLGLEPKKRLIEKIKSSNKKIHFLEVQNKAMKQRLDSDFVAELQSLVREKKGLLEIVSGATGTIDNLRKDLRNSSEEASKAIAERDLVKGIYNRKRQGSKTIDGPG